MRNSTERIRRLCLVLIAVLLSFHLPAGIGESGSAAAAKASGACVLYLYGAPANFELTIQEYQADAFIREVEDLEKEFEWNLDSGRYLVRITFACGPEYDYKLVGSPGYRLDTDVISGWRTVHERFVVPADEPVVDFSNVSYGNGALYGYVKVYHPDDEAADAVLQITDADGNKEDLQVDGVPEGDKEYIYYLDEYPVPPDGTYLQLSYKDGSGVEKTASVKLWLEALDFPSVTLSDLEPAAGVVRYGATFDHLPNHPDLAYYKFVVGDRYSPAGGVPVAFIPSSENVFELPAFNLNHRDGLWLQFIDRYGNPSLMSMGLSPIDHMAGQTGMIPYNLPSDDWLETVYQSFADEDVRPGYVTGDIRWTRPTVTPFVYDLYFGDEEGNIIGGLARIWHEDGEWEEWVHRLEGVALPPGAASLVVVPVFSDVYDPSWLVVMLEDRAASTLVTGSGFQLVEANGNVYGYVPVGMSAGDLKGKFEFLEGTEATVVDADGNALDDLQPVSPGVKLRLKLGSMEEEIAFIFLSERIRSELGKPDGEPLTLADVAGFVIGKKMDVTGDGVFDREDVRLLLGEIVGQ